MKLFGIQIGRSNDQEETPVLKVSENYPVDEPQGNEDEIMERVQRVRVCDRCAAVHYGVHSCRH